MQRGCIAAKKLRPDAGILDLAGRHAGPTGPTSRCGWLLPEVLHGREYRPRPDRPAGVGAVRRALIPVGTWMFWPRSEMAIAAVVAARDKCARPPQHCFERQRAIGGSRTRKHIGVAVCRYRTPILQAAASEIRLRCSSAGEGAASPDRGNFRRSTLVDQRGVCDSSFVICITMNGLDLTAGNPEIDW